MDIVDKNNRKMEVARRRSFLEEEKRMRCHTFLQFQESRDQKAAEKRKEGIQKAKEKAEAENQRVQAVVAEKRKKAQEEIPPLKGNKCRRLSCNGIRRLSPPTSTFYHSLPFPEQKTILGTSASRRYSMDTLSAHMLKPPSAPINPPQSTPKSKSVANLKTFFESSPKNGIRKLAKSIRNAAVKSKHSSSPPSKPQTTVVNQTRKEILDEIYQLEMDISKKDTSITHLEDYIDNLLCQIIEKCPDLLENE